MPAASRGGPPPGSASAALAPARSGYARQEVDVSALRSVSQPLELSLALPFGALFSALLPTLPFRVRSLQLEYVATDRLGPRATYSARVGGSLDGALELRLLVAHGAWLCVSGRAWLELAPPEAKLDGAEPLGAWQGGNAHG